MARYHVNPEGKVLVCQAQPGNCRYGEAETIHGATKQETMKLYEEKMRSSNINTIKKKPTTEDTIRENNKPKIIITADKLTAFKTIINSTNSRLKKAGITEEFTYEIEERNLVKTLDNGLRVDVPQYAITLNKPEIMLEGNKFQAVVVREEKGLIVKTNANDTSELNGWRPESLACDHCGKDTNRQKTYIIIDKNGERKQIGSTCVKYYLGVKPKGLWALEWELEDKKDSEDLGSITREDYKIPVDLTLAVALITTNNGKEYISTQSSYDKTSISTKEQVISKMFPSRVISEKEIMESRSLISEAEKLVGTPEFKKIKETIMSTKGDSDYIANVKTLLENDGVSYSNAGILVSAVRLYYNSIEKDKEKAKQESITYTPGHFGKVNEKIAKGTKFKVIKNGNYTKRAFGYYDEDRNCSLMTMQDETGKKITWFANDKLDIAEGSEITVSSGMVKSHGEYNGVDQTIINRVRLIKEA